MSGILFSAEVAYYTADKSCLCERWAFCIWWHAFNDVKPSGMSWCFSWLYLLPTTVFSC